MKLKLAENIRAFRKARHMTQEQLAEAMGVSVSAVYKWESRQSVPEIGLILKLADLFHTSTDTLLGYTWNSEDVSTTLARIETFAKAKQYQEAASEAEKLLRNYPNHFAVVYPCAQLYLVMGREQEYRDANRRAIQLLEHAYELISQNEDETVSEVSIGTQMAKAYLALGDPETALRILKRHNACGVNNALIGMILGDYLHDADGAEQYLGRAFSAFAEKIDDIMVGFANVFFQHRDYAAAIDCIQWLQVVLRGIQPEDQITWFDRYECILQEIIAEAYCMQGDLEQACQCLREALEHAVRFDGADPAEIRDMSFYQEIGLEHQPTYSAYGPSAVDGLRQRVAMESAAVPGLQKLWDSVVQEVLPDASV